MTPPRILTCWMPAGNLAMGSFIVPAMTAIEVAGASQGQQQL